MLDFLNRFAANLKYSQNGEEGILLECLSRFNLGPGVCVEVGANNGQWCSNTALLLESGWKGTMIEADVKLWEECVEFWRHNQNVVVALGKIGPTNINDHVTDKCDVFSTDTDGDDFGIFAALRARPKIAIVEIDSSIPPGQWGFNQDGGAGYREMVNLAYAKNFFLLCHTGNLVLVDRRYKSYFPEIGGDPIEDADLYFNTAWLK